MPIHLREREQTGPSHLWQILRQKLLEILSCQEHTIDRISCQVLLEGPAAAYTESLGQLLALSHVLCFACRFYEPVDGRIYITELRHSASLCLQI